MEQQPHDHRRRARSKLAGLEIRRSELRNRVLGISLALFGVVWAIVFVQMAAGNDPALDSSSRATTRESSASSGSNDSAAAAPAQYAIDPATGQIVLVPGAGGTSSGSTAQSPPPPVVTQTS